MKISRTHWQLLIMVGVFLVGWGVVTLISYYNSSKLEDKSLLSASNEEKAAKAVHALLMDEFDPIDPEITTAAVQEIVDRFNENLDSTFQYKLHILDHEMVNAFATLDGNIYLMRGLIEFAETPEVLAAVIAHEMGHIEHRDFETRLTRNISISALEMIVTGGNSNLAGELSKNLFNFKVRSVAGTVGRRLCERINDKIRDSSRKPQHPVFSS